MGQQNNILEEFHWLMDVLQSIDVGLVVLNREYEIELWNSFMQNHSALMPTDVMGLQIFSLFPATNYYLYRHTYYRLWY